MNVAITELDPTVMTESGGIPLTPNPASELSAFFSLVNGFLESISSATSESTPLPEARPAEVTAAALSSSLTISAKDAANGPIIEQTSPPNAEPAVRKQPAQKESTSKEPVKKEEDTPPAFSPRSLSESAPVLLPALNLVQYHMAQAGPTNSSEPEPGPKTGSVGRASQRLDAAPLLTTFVAAAANSSEPKPELKTGSVERASQGVDAAPSATNLTAEGVMPLSGSQGGAPLNSPPQAETVSIAAARQVMSVEPVAFVLRLTPEAPEGRNTHQVTALKAQCDVPAPKVYPSSAPLPQSTSAPEQDPYCRPDALRLIPAEPLREHSAASPAALRADAIPKSGQTAKAAAPAPPMRPARVESPGSMPDNPSAPAMSLGRAMPTEEKHMAEMAQRSVAFVSGPDQRSRPELPSTKQEGASAKPQQQAPAAPKSADSPAISHTTPPRHPDREQGATQIEPKETKNETDGKRETPAPMPGAKHNDGSGAIFETAAGLPRPIRYVIDRPSSTESHDMKITPPEVRQPAAPQLARQISLKLAAADSTRVNVDLLERAGKVQVSVRTPDHELAKSLQADLGDLVSRLENKGFKTETWVPSGAVHQPSGSSGSNTGYAQSGHSGSSSSRNPNSQQQNESNHRQQGRWTAEFEETLAADEKKSENL